MVQGITHTTQSRQEVEIRVENGFTFYRPKYKKDWYASGVDLCRLFGNKNPSKSANRIWTSNQEYLEENTCIINIPTLKNKKGTPPGGDPINILNRDDSAENLQQVRCYNRAGAWFFTSQIKTPQAKLRIKDLFNAFDTILRSRSKAQSMPIDWQQARIEGKQQRRALTDAIKLFVEYAKDNGSKNADWYYKTITQKINKLLFDIHGKGTPDGFRDNLSRVELGLLGIVEDRVAEYLIDCMDKKVEYHDSVAGFDGIVINVRQVLNYRHSVPQLEVT